MTHACRDLTLAMISGMKGTYFVIQKQPQPTLTRAENDQVQAWA
jgi:hypothetical protein